MENTENDNSLDITVEQVIKVLPPEKRIFIKPYGNRIYFEGRSNELPSCLLKLKVNELVPEICKNEDPYAIKHYYTEIGMWVEEVPWIDERLKETGISPFEKENTKVCMKHDNTAISGFPCEGKTRESKRRIIKLLKDNKKVKINNDLSISRKKVLEADPRYKKDGLYSADYIGCFYFYKFFIREDIQGQVKNLNIANTTYNLSSRNINCFVNILESIKKNDEDSFWHELSDFIHNYNSSTSITYDEYILYQSLFVFGFKMWNKSNDD